MKKKTKDMLINSLGFPIYVIVPDGKHTRVTKLEYRDRIRISKYVVAEERCSCPAFFKKGNCKHVQMIAGTYEGTGIPKYVIPAEVERLKSILKEGVPEIEKWEIDESKLPDKVTQISLDIPKSSKTPECATFYVERNFNVGTLAIKLNEKEK